MALQIMKELTVKDNQQIISIKLKIEIIYTMTIELYFLPEDVLFIVWDFIKDTDKISWCKQFFYRYHQELYREKFLFNNNYLFFIIRSDLFFILENLLLENSQELTKKIKRFSYKNVSFISKISLLHYYANALGQNKCHYQTTMFIKEHNLADCKKGNVKRRNNSF